MPFMSTKPFSPRNWIRTARYAFNDNTTGHLLTSALLGSGERTFAGTADVRWLWRREHSQAKTRIDSCEGGVRPQADIQRRHEHVRLWPESDVKSCSARLTARDYVRAIIEIATLVLVGKKDYKQMRRARWARLIW